MKNRVASDRLTTHTHSPFGDQLSADPCRRTAQEVRPGRRF